jgi:hypothetical protein
MKRNQFYAEAKAHPGMKDNGIRPDQIGHEREDMFIQEARYFEAYAKYFGGYIDAYKAKGISVGMVMPQNEFNSAQNFPSCTWTAEGLTRFLRYLGPEMEKRAVDVFFGALERGNPCMLETAVADKDVARFIKGVGTQWAGKNALPAVHQEFPSLLVFSVRAGMWRWQQQLALRRLLLATHEALLSQRRLSLHVLEHLDGRCRHEHLGMGAELSGECRLGCQEFPLHSRLSSAQAPDSLCRRWCSQLGNEWNLR